MVDLAALVLRVVVGGIFLAQGHRKVLADPDLPHGRVMLTNVIASKGFPRPELLAGATGLVELVGGLLVVLGLLTRPALVPLVVILVVAIAPFKWEAGFFGGWDWPLSVLGGSVALFLLGPGRYSADAFFGLPF